MRAAAPAYTVATAISQAGITAEEARVNKKRCRATRHPSIKACFTALKYSQNIGL